VYLSNENPTPVEVYFDDFSVMRVQSPVVQMDEYHPFGVTFNSYSRENSVPQRFLYQGKGWQQYPGLDLYDFQWRQQDPSPTWTTTMDPHADTYGSLSPYSWAANNPIRIIDPDGRDITSYTGAGRELQKYLRG
jgi:RHS repeat-associated protein